MINFLSASEEIKGELIKIRHHIHKNPELSAHEFNTANYIENIFKDLGIEPQRLTQTGFIARLNFKNAGKNIALRSDLDALPVNESTGVEFASCNSGVMHACGHDVHMTGLIGAAMLLKKFANDLNGSVTFIFEPDEEDKGGALNLIKAGALENVNAIFGAHVSPDLPAGHVGFKYGAFYAAAEVFKVMIYGKSSHAAEPEKGIDALKTACEIVNDLSKIKGGVLSVCKFNSGRAVNIISDNAEFEGIIRTFGLDNRKRMCEHVMDIVKNISHLRNTEYGFIFRDSYPGVINDDGMTELAKSAAEKILTPEKVHVIEKPTYMTEDFGYYLDKCPGSFYHVGAGCNLPLHIDKFLPSDEILNILAAVHSGIVFEALK